MSLKHKLTSELKEIAKTLGLDIEPVVDYPADTSHGDYSTNIALIGAKKLYKNPMELAEEFVRELKVRNNATKTFIKIEAAQPGFINLTVSDKSLLQTAKNQNIRSLTTSLSDKRIMIEFAHPNTHKEMHIGHMRTLITGEAIARLSEAGGASVFRANYQGDIGPHVAKALYGVQKLMQQKGLTFADMESWTDKDKVHFLGEAYVEGNKDYEEKKDEIDDLNEKLYQRDQNIMEVYQITRQWSLDYYQDFYERFYTKFDKLFFESQMDEEAKRIVETHLGRIFEKDNGAVIFPGERYGLHTRVFLTQKGYPTYEGKEMALAYAQYQSFQFDKNIHVVANEQAGYFKVVLKALELLDSHKFKDKEMHLSMGMVQLSDRKMSSRTGDVLTVDWLLDQIKDRAMALMSRQDLSEEERADIVEKVTIGAVKYSVIRVSTGQDVAFDIEKSVSLDGDSGPYLQYAYARTQSVLRKTEIDNFEFRISNFELEHEERDLIRLLCRFEDIVEESAVRFAPNTLCAYLFELAKAYNLFYQKLPILKTEEDVKSVRLGLTKITGDTIRSGLDLLGIKVPEKM